jgi:hypothetical protein
LGENTYIGQIHFIFQSVLHSFGLDEIEGTQIETLGPRLHHGLAKQVGIPISWYKHNCNVTNDSNAQFEAFIATDISYGVFHFNRATPFIIHDKPSSYWGTSISGNLPDSSKSQIFIDLRHPCRSNLWTFCCLSAGPSGVRDLFLARWTYDFCWGYHEISTDR